MFLPLSPSSSPGVGISGVIANTLMSTSYEAILSYAAYYLFSSFQTPLPWTFEVEGANCTNTAAEGTQSLVLCWYSDTPLKLELIFMFYGDCVGKFILV